MGSFLFWAIVFIAIYYLSLNFLKNPQNIDDSSLTFIEAKYLVSLLAKVAKSDGRVNELEARLISEILDDIGFKLRDAGKRDELKRIYAAEKENLSNVYELAREYKKSSAITKEPMYMPRIFQLIRCKTACVAGVARIKIRSAAAAREIQCFFPENIITQIYIRAANAKTIHFISM